MTTSKVGKPPNGMILNGDELRAYTASPGDALDRTLLLMRDDLDPDVPDEALINALLDRRVIVVSDAANLESISGQTAFVTIVLLLLRSGTSVVVAAPDVPILGHQPPL